MKNGIGMTALGEMAADVKADAAMLAAADKLTDVLPGPFAAMLGDVAEHLEIVADSLLTLARDQAAEPATDAAPAKRPSRPRKPRAVAAPANGDAPKRGRGRPRKVQADLPAPVSPPDLA